MRYGISFYIALYLCSTKAQRLNYTRHSHHKTLNIQIKKNVPWHILAPSAVACDSFLLRASAHPAERLFTHRTQFPMSK